MVKWYKIFSFWIFILSILSALHILPYSTFPLHVVALIGILEMEHYFPHESYWKYVTILGLHVAPFLWVSYSFSIKTIMACLFWVLVYIAFMAINKYSIIKAYTKLLQEKHIVFSQFTMSRFGFGL